MITIQLDEYDRHYSVADTYEWCVRELGPIRKGIWRYKGKGCFAFTTQEDAMMFALRWS